jgi:hypothetical protein
MTFELLAKQRVTIAAPIVREAMQDAREEIASTFDNVTIHMSGNEIDGNAIAQDIRAHRFAWEVSK